MKNSSVSNPPYPIAKQNPFIVHSPHGDRVDNYFWLRDDDRVNSEVIQYLNEENTYTEKKLQTVDNLKKELYEELISRIAPDDSSVPVLHRGYWYWQEFEAGDDYPKYKRKNDKTQEVQVLLNGPLMAQGQVYFQIGSFEVSDDDRYCAYTVDLTGRREYTLKIRDLSTGLDIADEVINVEPEFVWMADNQTILYIEKDPDTLLSVRIKRHTIGDPSKSNLLIYEEMDHQFYMSIHTGRSEKLIYIDLQSTEQSEALWIDRSDTNITIETVCPRRNNIKYYVDDYQDQFIIQTNQNAPNWKICTISKKNSQQHDQWKSLIEQRSDIFIESFQISQSGITLNVCQSAQNYLEIFNWGSNNPIQLIKANNNAGMVELRSTPDINSPWIRYVETALNQPRITYDFNLQTGERLQRKFDKIMGDFNPSNYQTKLITISSHEGEEIPVSLVWHNDVKLDGSAPLWLYAYGSYGLSMTPGFNRAWLSLLNRGFVVAIAHIRGGQECGRRWYEAGRQHSKINSFHDFIAVRDGLAKLGWIDPENVFAHGGSAGGLLMGGVANMAPEKFKGIIADVPFVDIVTTMLDASIPLTTNEYDEWGNPERNEDYHYMLSYSPYDNLEAKDYPAMLVTTGLWDSQVQYWEPAKWVAKLRHLKTNQTPLLLFTDMNAGHGGKSGRYQRDHDTALRYAFVLGVLKGLI